MNIFNKVVVKDSNIDKGIRINPTPQQGGTQTIQQSVYLTHNNPCGINLLAFQPIGNVKITYFQLKIYLDTILNTDEVLEQFKIVRELGTVFLYNPTLQNQLAYLYALMNWGIIANKYLPVAVKIPNFQWRIVVANYNGVMIYDNNSPNIRIVNVDSNGVYSWGTIPLRTNFTSTTVNGLPNTSIRFKNPFIPVGQTTVNIYNITNNLSLTNMFNRTTTIGRQFSRTSYQDNQISLPEPTMAVMSLLTDPANSRVFGFPRYGFSAREVTNNGSDITYNCAYLQEVYTINDPKLTVIDTVYIRLSLELDIDDQSG